jgi:hypothetical protein
MGLQDFHSNFKILFAVDLKQSGFWPSADVKPATNDLAHAMPWKLMFALSIYISMLMIQWNYPGACIIKLITAVIYGFRNKLECFSLASLSRIV